MTTKTSFFVNFTEIDGMGIVHHSVYPLWFEKARWDFFKKAGTSKAQITGNGLFLPLSEMECKYRSPAKFGDGISVLTKISAMSCVKIKFEYTILNTKNGKTLALGKTVHAWTDKSISPVNLEKTAPDIYFKLKQIFEVKENV